MTKLAKVSTTEIFDKFKPAFPRILKALDDAIECTIGSTRFVELKSRERSNIFYNYTLIRKLISLPSEKGFEDFKFEFGNYDDFKKYVDMIEKDFKEGSESPEQISFEKMNDACIDLKKLFEGLYEAVETI